MARLRKPSPNEPTIFEPPSEARATRTSPRKATRKLRYTSSSEDEEPILVPKASSRELHYLSSQQADESCFRIPAPVADGLTPRKQRVLRPVESNSRLLRKLSGQSLASPEKKQRERRVRSGTTDVDVGNKTRLMYAKTLAKSVIRKQASRANISVVGQDDLESLATPSRVSTERIVNDLEDEEMEEAETTVLCGEDGDAPVESIETQEDGSSEEEDPVVHRRQRQRQARTRRVDSDSDEEDEIVIEPSIEQPPPLHSMRPQHRKGHSTISNWAQEVVDLTSSPEPQASFVVPPLPPPSHHRGESFTSARSVNSASSGALAILTYSPTPTKSRSPRKAPPISRPSTPPLAPPSPSKLVSPSKKKPAIPKAPNLRPSLDAFWNPEVVNEWNEKHSPVKTLVSPKKQKWREDMVKMMEGVDLEDSSCTDEDFPSPTTSPRKKQTKKVESQSPKKKAVSTEELSVKEVRAQRKDFAAKKHAIAEAFLLELDKTLCDGTIGTMTQCTGGIKLVWSKTLKTTAGRANWRREQLRLRTGSQPNDFKVEVRHHCSIELAEKVIDDEERLYNVLAHEFCHLTTFMISDVRNNPHGAEFKSWGRKATTAFTHKGVEVTTKHTYQIEYRYVWECVGCGCEFKRHSKSVDPVRHSCGRCKGKLVQTKPTPRGGAAAKDGKKEKSEYQVFVKENFSRVKKELAQRGEDAAMGKVMEAVAREYREMKAKREKAVDKELEDALEGLKI